MRQRRNPDTLNTVLILAAVGGLGLVLAKSGTLPNFKWPWDGWLPKPAPPPGSACGGGIQVYIGNNEWDAWIRPDMRMHLVSNVLHCGPAEPLWVGAQVEVVGIGVTPYLGTAEQVFDVGNDNSLQGYRIDTVLTLPPYDAWAYMTGAKLTIYVANASNYRLAEKIEAGGVILTGV